MRCRCGLGVGLKCRWHPIKTLQWLPEVVAHLMPSSLLVKNHSIPHTHTHTHTHTEWRGFETSLTRRSSTASPGWLMGGCTRSCVPVTSQRSLAWSYHLTKLRCSGVCHFGYMCYVSDEWQGRGCISAAAPKHRDCIPFCSRYRTF